MRLPSWYPYIGLRSGKQTSTAYGAKCPLQCLAIAVLAVNLNGGMWTATCTVALAVPVESDVPVTFRIRARRWQNRGYRGLSSRPMHIIRRPLSILKSPRQPVFEFFHEYQPIRIEPHPCRRDCLACSIPADDYRTTLFVMFEGETQRRFSSVRIVLYCDVAFMRDPLDDSRHQALAIQQLEPVTDGARDHCVRDMPHNDHPLPQLTVAFKVFPRHGSMYDSNHDLIPPSSDDELRRRDSKSVRILLESNHSITPDTLSVSMTFKHSSRLRPLPIQHHYTHRYSAIKYATARTVRVVPMDGARPRKTICCLPTELLMKIFEAIDSCAWQQDLLSFARVCRQWSQCSMKVLFARLKSPEHRCACYPTQSLDPCAFAKALSKTPVLGLGIQYLDLDQHNGSAWDCQHHSYRKASPGFAQALIAILRATKNLQFLHLSLGYSPKVNPLFSALPNLHDLHTLSITRTRCRFASMPPKKYWTYSMSTMQLARCMARWPALTSLTVEHLVAENIRMRRLFLVQPPACALTQLRIRDSHISDKDLLYLTAPSARTLTQVTLDNVCDITDDGLYVFLDASSRNVTSLTIWDVELKSSACPSRREEQHALDAVVDRMRCLQALDIRGDIASERMLRRRSEMFARSCGSGVPVVRLSFQAVPGIWGCQADEWAGWEVVEFS